MNIMATGGSKTGAAFLMLNVGVPDGPSSNTFRYRDGAANDQDHILSVFIYQLGFELKHSVFNFCKKEWNHKYNPGKHACGVGGSYCMVCLIKNTDYSNYEYVVFHVSSHGYCDEKNVLQIQCLNDSVEEYITLEEIVEAFSDKSCPGLIDKTRILIIQACRHTETGTPEADDPGVAVDVEYTRASANGQPETGTTQKNPPTKLAPVDGSSTPSVLNIPENFLIVYSTTQNRYALRNSQTGSWFSYELKNVVDAFPADRPMNFLQVLTATASKVAERTAKAPKDAGKESKPECTKNVPSNEHRLTKSIIFRKV